MKADFDEFISGKNMRWAFYLLLHASTPLKVFEVFVKSQIQS
jgi:hypothetical protein